MVFAYIGAAAVVGLLIGLVTLSVVWTARTVSAGIRSRSVNLLTTYDKLLEERSRDLRAMEEAVRERREKLEQEARDAVAYDRPQESCAVAGPQFMKAIERIGGTPYRAAGTGAVYREIRQGFAYDPARVLQELPIRTENREAGAATRLLEDISFDTVYELSTLSREQQLAVLEQTLPEEGKQLLQDYREENSRFDCISFYDYLQARAAAEPGPVCLRVPADQAERTALPHVKVVADAGICEGFQIEADNVLYDYCIKMDEIG